jgi:hypothetical protein
MGIRSQPGRRAGTEAREILTEPGGTAPGDPLFIPLMTRFSRAARAHIAYAEQQVCLRTALPADDAGWLGEELAAAAKALPGRVIPAHPACGGHSFRGRRWSAPFRLPGYRGRP